MKINRAIKNLKAGRKDCGMIPPKEFTATIDLAIEALKAWKEHRGTGSLMNSLLLPGETEEE